MIPLVVRAAMIVSQHELAAGVDIIVVKLQI